MDDQFQRCCFSITCKTDDLAVVHCLRGLCQHNVKDWMKQVAWGGTKEPEWRRAGNQITLRFTSPEQRESFVGDATRLLRTGSWHEVKRSDNDPAHRQRR
jgi:hypothetical protein